MSTHTPGPWTLGRCGKSGRQHIDGHVDGSACWLELASVWVKVEEEPSEIGEANARLIAAAPKLLAACETALSTGVLGHGGVDEILRDAIAEATGSQP